MGIPAEPPALPCCDDEQRAFCQRKLCTREKTLKGLRWNVYDIGDEDIEAFRKGALLVLGKQMEGVPVGGGKAQNVVTVARFFFFPSIIHIEHQLRKPRH